MWVCTSISPGNPVYFDRSITSAPAGIADASAATLRIRPPSMITIAFVHSFPLASHNFPNRTALTGLALLLLRANSRGTERSENKTQQESHRFHRASPLD